MIDANYISGWLSLNGLSILLKILFLLVIYKALLFFKPLRHLVPGTYELLFEHIVERFLRAFLIVLGAIYILPHFGVDTIPIIAGLGFMGFALTFASQRLIGDIISGFMLMAENKFTKGDDVEFAGKEGVVNTIGLRGLTLIDKKNGRDHFIPYGDIRTISKKLIKETDGQEGTI